MSKKFVSKANLQKAWQTRIQPKINKKQDQLPEGTVGQILTKTDEGVEWQDVPSIDGLSLVRITRADYDAQYLAGTLDEDTLYVITG